MARRVPHRGPLPLAGLLLMAACAPPAPSDSLSALRSDLQALIEEGGGEVGLYYRSLGAGGDSITLDADTRMHAASTMKVPVMMQLYMDDEAGLRSLDDPVEVTTAFTSIVDGSSFVLPPESDSDTTFYGRAGDHVPVRELIDRMITWSSNLATNILIQVADARRVTETLRELGADSMEVLRGVEDLKAYQAGLSNTATARDLGIVMAEVATGERFSAESRASMLAVLERQHFRENIPAGLPDGTRVANKTGWITAHNHDAAVVFPRGHDPYVLVVMVRGIEEQAVAASLVARLSGRVWTYHTASPRPEP